MDDYDTSVLSEAKNEYTSRLITTLTPIVIQGIQSIFNEAEKLCYDNDEDDKYLMTFQNFLTRVPKWNSTIIEEETTRIVKTSGCNYLEDLLTCVHITQLKILTSIRVANKQKKIDINIPKLSDFIHKIYIAFARKLYSNVYLFEKDILPLTHQKNMRECEIIAQECILNTVRENMPIESILRAYMDETVDEEIIEEVTEKQLTPQEEKQLKEEEEEKRKEKLIKEAENDTIIKQEKPILINTEPQKQEDWLPDPPKAKEEDTVNNIIMEIAENKKVEENIVDGKLKFNDNDSVLDMGTNKESLVNAPKTDERLDKIAKEQHEKRKAEEAAEDDDEEKLTIFENVDLKLDNLDINNLEKKVETRPDPLLEDIEVLG
jgi:hypothetical protein